ncbi:MAG: SPOR domain-containing protein [Clostridiales bacterium]|jgi:predicted DNA-binding protein YlxM (UPF0122 family)|nr:SPOR domain-containing protein [Clostridiales bacterium]
MRYSRIKRRNTQRRYTSVIILGLLLFLGFYIASAGAAGNFISRIVAPIIAAFDNDVEQQDANDDITEPSNTDLTLPENKEGEKNERITDHIDIAPMSFHAIQLAAFTEEKNARAAAAELQGKGGAGFILNDKYLRLLAMGFISEDDAQKVRQQLKDEGIESQIYIISCPGANMEIAASAEKVDSIKTAFSLWLDKTKSLEGIIRDLDTSQKSAEDALKDIEDIMAEFGSMLDKLNTYSATEESNHILAGLQELYQRGKESLNDILSEKTANRVAISAKIKYTYIDMIHQYKLYMDQITKV